jgi:hypothetical protein
VLEADGVRVPETLTASTPGLPQQQFSRDLRGPMEWQAVGDFHGTLTRDPVQPCGRSPERRAVPAVISAMQSSRRDADVRSYFN